MGFGQTDPARQTEVRGCLVAYWRVDLLEQKEGCDFILESNDKGLHTGSSNRNQEKGKFRNFQN